MQIQTVEVRDIAQIEALERQLQELNVKLKDVEQKYAFEKTRPKYPPVPMVTEHRSSFEYIQFMVRQGIDRLPGKANSADFKPIFRALFSVILNYSYGLLNNRIGKKLESVPKHEIAAMTRRILQSLERCLESELGAVRASLE